MTGRPRRVCLDRGGESLLVKALQQPAMVKVAQQGGAVDMVQGNRTRRFFVVSDRLPGENRAAYRTRMRTENRKPAEQ